MFVHELNLDHLDKLNILKAFAVVPCLYVYNYRKIIIRIAFKININVCVCAASEVMYPG